MVVPESSEYFATEAKTDRLKMDEATRNLHSVKQEKTSLCVFVSTQVTILTKEPFEQIVGLRKRLREADNRDRLESGRVNV